MPRSRTETRSMPPKEPSEKRSLLSDKTSLPQPTTRGFRSPFLFTVVALVTLSYFAFTELSRHVGVLKRAPNADISKWLDAQVPFAKVRILAHINKDGAVVAGAAPPVGTGDDGYQYYWVRDGGLSMMALADYFERAKSGDISSKFEAFHNWTLRTQEAARRSSPGWFEEKQAWTKYNLDGTPYLQWMSPQYDGPALRALAFMKYGKLSGTSARYYRANAPDSVVKTDLDAIVRSWQETDGYEPWEEVIGSHFFDRFIQYRALKDGAKFVADLGDRAGAEAYDSVAEKVKATLDAFWDGKIMKASLVARNGGDNDGAATKVKRNHFVDISPILGVIHASDDATYPATSDRMQATFYELVNAFLNGIYQPDIVLSDWSLNHNDTTLDGLPLNPGIGRYPEDIYDGKNYRYPGAESAVSSGAGFWFLATNAMAEMLYKAVIQYSRLEYITITNNNVLFWKFIGIPGDGPRLLLKGSRSYVTALASLVDHGDRFLRRTRKYVTEEGYMSEQFHYATGKQQGTRDLCWSYASVISANTQREIAVKIVATMPVKPQRGDKSEGSEPKVSSRL